MVVAYWGTGPSPSDYAYVLDDYPGTSDPWVDYAAHYTFDYHYDGAGNWPFNVAYAGNFGLDGEVTQLHSLAEAEQFIKAGIPLVASIAFTSNKLDGFLFKSTNGHLLVIVGFDRFGNPVVNDPAATSDATVQRTYDRAQFEQNWMTSTGGIVYVILLEWSDGRIAARRSSTRAGARSSADPPWSAGTRAAPREAGLRPLF